MGREGRTRGKNARRANLENEGNAKKHVASVGYNRSSSIAPDGRRSSRRAGRVRFRALRHRRRRARDGIRHVKVGHRRPERLRRVNLALLRADMRVRRAVEPHRRLDVVHARERGRYLLHSSSDVADGVVRKRRAHRLRQRANNLPILLGAPQRRDRGHRPLRPALRVDVRPRLLRVRRAGEDHVRARGADVAVVALVHDEGAGRFFNPRLRAERIDKRHVSVRHARR
eukprot:31045-Pelagococcus_subviridis.AAC.7